MKIFVYDEFGPQDTAMMQALYSRSPLSVEEHVKKVKESGSGSFMERFYVGYGHASIADCGSTTLFIEGISMLCDKAIQDWPLYSGQETSTRYIDMSRQPIIDPIGSNESKAILDKWMDFYVNSQEIVGNHLKEKYPKKDDENADVYEKAIKARTFDILRSFLPAGITTQLSWHTNLRQAWDKLCWLRHNPLKEVRDAAEEMLNQLKSKYSHSFGFDLIPEQEKYREYVSAKYNYFNPEDPKEFEMKTTVKKEDISTNQDIFSMRPEKTGLPFFAGEIGSFQFEFIMDFGSFRDIQRHRAGVIRMPLLTVKHEFQSWYLEQLPNELKIKAEKLINEQAEAISKLDCSDEIRQYYIAMGFNVPVRATFPMPGMIYLVELRSGKYVHPTLRKIAHKMYEAIQKEFPELVIHADLNLDDWDVRRGLQDITVKN